VVVSFLESQRSYFVESCIIDTPGCIRW